jgi:tetratricopeptide (TPR) repeat protein
MKMLRHSLRVGGLLLCFVFGIQMIVPGQQASNSDWTELKSADVVRLVLKGFRLSSPEAEKLEKTLLADPKNLIAHITLVAYYTSQHDELSRIEKSEHALWLIRNIPDLETLHDVAYARLGKRDRGYEEAKQLWLKHLETYHNNMVVLANAAEFFIISDKQLSEKLFKQSAVADPNNPRWPSELGQLYMMEMQNATYTPQTTGADKKSLAASAYQIYERAYRLQHNDQEKRMLISRLATSAFEAGQIETAQLWALEALNDAKNARSDWSVADSVHHAHIILGRIALRSGDLTEAREHLIQAARSEGSPVLGSFGPNMMLAKELLEKGARDAVIQYFQKCASFWRNDRGQLVQWAATVREGGIPNFGANLAY